MPDQSTDELENWTNSFDDRERELLYLLTEPKEGQSLWSVADLSREIGQHDVDVLLLGLHCAGLINKTSDGFVFATRPAVRLAHLVDHAS